MSLRSSDSLAEMRAFLDAEAVEARFDRVTRTLYSTDASNHQVPPLGVVFPRHRDQVAGIVAKAAELRMPVLPRGAGTSLAGQAVGPCLIVDTARFLDRILELEPEAGLARVEPGVVCQSLNAAAQRHGLKFGPDPASADRATFGGMLGNNATGAHSVQFGMTADHALRVTMVCGDGSLQAFEPVQESEAQRRAGGTSIGAGIYRTLLALRHSSLEAVRDRWPRTWRRSSGYGLNYLVGHTPDAPASWYRAPEPYLPPDLVNLPAMLCGSEGTLGVFVEAVVRLVRRPRATSLLLLSFESVAEACAEAVDLLENDPAAVELIPAAILQRAKAIPGYARNLGFLASVPTALLAVEFDGETPAEAAAKAGETRRNGTLLEDPRRQAEFWEVRKAGLGLLMSVPGDTKPSTFIEDVSVPVADLPEYVRRVDAILASAGTAGEWYAHASAGCLHLRPMVNLKTDVGRRQMREIADAIVEEAYRLHGAVSGEHGDGLSHTEFNARLFGPELTEAFRKLKTAFDPEGILNPGKIVALEGAPGASIDKDLRYRAGDAIEVPLDTEFAFRRELGFQRAVEACTGVGVCRKDGGVMCPSFQATRDERDSTRGRANALRAALTGWLPASALLEPDLYAVLDLCLECKGCKAECPTGVDMARVKAEFLHAYQMHHGTSLRSRLLAQPARLQGWLRAAAPVHNALRRSRLFRQALHAAVGIDRRRVLPEIQRRRFRDILRPMAASKGSRSDAAILFVDTFTDLNEPDVGKAAVRVLEAAGATVGRAPGQVCCGRPLISKGMLPEAKRLARANIDALAPYAQAGLAIVGLEPSCLLTLRDEYLEFFPDDPRAHAVAGAALLFEEFLVAPSGEARRIDRIAWKPDGPAGLVHNHCHAKAMVGSGPLLAALAGPAPIRETSAGCCGMAGSFGYETEHYALSMDIANLRLLPEMRQGLEQGAVPIAAGMSCRTQIRDALGVEAVHPAIYLAARLRST
ncbi:MAG TPA: FAD-linked oxidase C-terminal domain-containing protein [Anaerolineales bacterium]|nr:FAD-linked oxidase C-terminal domain-containing protein [Anaerolineales bacterium]